MAVPVKKRSASNLLSPLAVENWRPLRRLAFSHWYYGELSLALKKPLVNWDRWGWCNRNRVHEYRDVHNGRSAELTGLKLPLSTCSKGGKLFEFTAQLFFFVHRTWAFLLTSNCKWPTVEKRCKVKEGVDIGIQSSIIIIDHKQSLIASTQKCGALTLIAEGMHLSFLCKKPHAAESFRLYINIRGSI